MIETWYDGSENGVVAGGSCSSNRATGPKILFSASNLIPSKSCSYEYIAGTTIIEFDDSNHEPFNEINQSIDLRLFR